MMCAGLRYASRGLFVDLPQKMSRQLACFLRFRGSGGFDSTSSEKSFAHEAFLRHPWNYDRWTPKNIM